MQKPKTRKNPGGRPRTPENVVRQIRNLWSENPKRSAASVYRRYREVSRTEDVGQRKVQQIIRELKTRVEAQIEMIFLPVEWRPWQDTTASSEDEAYLLSLDRLSLEFEERHLYQHEAKWARRLRVALQDLASEAQWFLVTEYGRREASAINLREAEPFTEDLDGILMFKAWLPEGWEAHRLALGKGQILEPMFATAVPLEDGGVTWVYGAEALFLGLVKYNDIWRTWWNNLLLKGARGFSEQYPELLAGVEKYSLEQLEELDHRLREETVKRRAEAIEDRSVRSKEGST